MFKTLYINTATNKIMRCTGAQTAVTNRKQYANFKKKHSAAGFRILNTPNTKSQRF
jgi:hypothetical protein